MQAEIPWLLVGDGAAVLGRYFQIVAVAALAFHLTHGVALMAAQLAAGALAGAAAAPLAGRLIDRARDRRAHMIAADLYRAAVTATLAVAHHPWQVPLLGAASALGDALYHPARGAFVVEVAGRDGVVRWNALRGVTSGAARLLGPLLAGALASRLGPAPALLLDAAGYLASALATLPVRPRSRPPSASPSRPAAGYGPLLRDPLLRRTLTVRMWSLVGQWGVNTAWFVWIQAAAFGSAGVMGAGIAAYEGASMLAGALLPRLVRRPAISFVGAIGALEAGCWCLYPFVHGAAFALALCAAEGLGAWTLNSLLTTLIQRRIPEAALGSALAAEHQVDAAAHLTGIAAAAALAPLLGLPAAFPAMAALAAVGWAATASALPDPHPDPRM